jgi:choline dehydrogenase-like flavoprotein
VLLLEGADDVPSVRETRHWLANLGTERDWGFQAVPNPLLNGRRLLFSIGKVLGGGSSINAMVWSRGHKNDWEYFADQAGDPGWNCESVLACRAVLGCPLPVLDATVNCLASKDSGPSHSRIISGVPSSSVTRSPISAGKAKTPQCDTACPAD